MSNKAKAIAEKLIDFLNASPSPFHAVEQASKQLLAAGFEKIREGTTQKWELKPKGKYFFTRNSSSLIAFVVGGNYQPGNGFNVIGAHTDSPVLKVKPVSKMARQSFVQLAVETYGGGLWHTWFDRDLALAGRVILLNHSSENNSFLQQRLVRIRKPILRIPTLAIHLDRSVNAEGFKFNLESQLVPVLATEIKTRLEASTPAAPAEKTADNDKTKTERHSSVLLTLLASELGCSKEDIVDFELCLCDVQPSCLGGFQDEFLFSGRLDNLASSYCSLHALIETFDEKNQEISTESRISVVALFDNEEIGSVSERGASSSLFESFVKQVTYSFPSSSSSSSSSTLEESLTFEKAMRNSFLLSADMAHACHPNFADKHEERHRPQLHGGPVIKENANQKYATTAITGSLIRHIAQRNGIPLQDFVSRNDVLCGSTIGPLMSVFGLRAVDVGIPQLSMHSIREMCGVEDLLWYVLFFQAFFREITVEDQKLIID